ncbi:hypothetical protein M8J77_000505 [Diaphorina citri]|nr:hypothetical protein M8J77_000505 [Diaphorina citri]
MFNCGIQMIPDRTRFNQSDPPELMPTYLPTHLSPEQQAKLDGLKFQTMKSDYEYFRDHPEIHEIVGFILERMFLDKPLQIKAYLSDLFRQPDIKQRLSEYRNNKQCHKDRRFNVEKVKDLGYKIVPSDGPRTQPCATLHEDQMLCDDRIISPHVMRHMKQLYDNREAMLPSYDAGLLSSCPQYDENGNVLDSTLTGAPQECAMYGGDYIFLRNTRCGRRIAQYIGDTDEIPARPWPHDTFHLTPALSVNIEEEAGEVEEKDAMEEIRDIEDIKSKGTEESIVLSNVSSTELRHYFQSEHKTQARVESSVIPSVQDVLESDQGNVMKRWDSQSAFVAKLMNTKRKNFG